MNVARRFVVTDSWHDGGSPANWINNTQEVAVVYDGETGRSVTVSAHTQGEAFAEGIEKLCRQK
jgi:hypothetical protein